MATEGPLIHDGSQCTALADYSTNQFCAVKNHTVARQVALASTGGEGIYGILQNKPLAGQAADVGIVGVTKAKAGAVFNPGDLLMTDTSGRLITATGGNHAVAVALEGAGAADVIVTVSLVPGLGVGKVL